MDFRHIWETASDEDLFRELIFCLLTPQSKAKTCWKAVQRLERKCMIAEAVPAAITEELVGVRFNQRKAEYICLARSQFAARSLRKTLADFAGPVAAREWLVENVKGLGYKEASHFLRNIGLGEDLAILDRHILKNLALLGVIDEVPSSPPRGSTWRSRGRWPPSPKRQRFPWASLTSCSGIRKRERSSSEALLGQNTIQIG